MIGQAEGLSVQDIVDFRPHQLPFQQPQDHRLALLHWPTTSLTVAASGRHAAGEVPGTSFAAIAAGAEVGETAAALTRSTPFAGEPANRQPQAAGLSTGDRQIERADTSRIRRRRKHRPAAAASGLERPGPHRTVVRNRKSYRKTGDGKIAERPCSWQELQTEKSTTIQRGKIRFHAG